MIFVVEFNCIWIVTNLSGLHTGDDGAAGQFIICREIVVQPSQPRLSKFHFKLLAFSSIRYATVWSNYWRQNSRPALGATAALVENVLQPFHSSEGKIKCQI